jgi:hypothetical protein
MPSTLHDFYFDVNFAFGDESVFAWIDQEGTSAAPEGNALLLTDLTPLLLTDSSDLLLAA